VLFLPHILDKELSEKIKENNLNFKVKFDGLIGGNPNNI
jgi:hypothetical protein